MATIAQTVKRMLLEEGEQFVWFGSTSILESISKSIQMKNHASQMRIHPSSTNARKRLASLS